MPRTEGRFTFYDSQAEWDAANDAFVAWVKQRAESAGLHAEEHPCTKCEQNPAAKYNTGHYVVHVYNDSGQRVSVHSQYDYMLQSKRQDFPRA